MYPDWPETNVDLVPLPVCEGPKLKPFDFRGPQQIEFLEQLGRGQHSHVFKVKILGSEYALKLFRFVNDGDWYGPGEYDLNKDRESMTVLAQYTEPFNCECRAFGRLREAGQQELAVACYGYILLDEAHERTLIDRFKVSFDGSWENPGDKELRTRFPGKRSGKPPPIRGIVKAFGSVETPRSHGNLPVRRARRILQDIITLQQLGIIGFDVRRDNFVDGKFGDFSTAVTTPHFLTTPELNPNLSPSDIANMEHTAFKFSISDYWDYDEMIMAAMQSPHQKSQQLTVVLCGGLVPGPVFGIFYEERYDFRRPRRSQQRVYTLVDTRRHDWRQFREGRALTKQRRGRPDRWYLDCSPEEAAQMIRMRDTCTTVEWMLKDGFVHPMPAGYGERTWFERCGEGAEGIEGQARAD